MTVQYKCLWCARWRALAHFINAKGKRCVKCKWCRQKPRKAALK